MTTAGIHAIAYLLSGVLLLVLAVVCFYVSKAGAKRFFRILVADAPTIEQDYRMFRALLSFVVAGAFFFICALWGAVRVLDVDRWISAFGA